MTKLSVFLAACFTLFIITFSNSIYAFYPSLSSYFSVTDAIYSISSQSRNLKPSVVSQALTAYDCALAKGIPDPKQIITIIDYSLPSNIKRLWVIDLRTRRVLINTYVAHAQNSGDMIPTRFSNSPETHASSLGLFRTGDAYFGQHGYSVRLIGLEQGFNNNAYSRAIVVHGAWYANAQSRHEHHGIIGRSWGCFAVPPENINAIANTIRQGTFLFAYYPQHNWLNHSQFLHCNIA